MTDKWRGLKLALGGIGIDIPFIGAGMVDGSSPVLIFGGIVVGSGLAVAGGIVQMIAFYKSAARKDHDADLDVWKARYAEAEARADALNVERRKANNAHADAMERIVDLEAELSALKARLTPESPKPGGG